MTFARLGLTIALTAFFSCARGGTGKGVELEVAFPHLKFVRPLALVHAGDGSNRLFVVEQSGRIFAFPNNPAVRNAKVFLDVRDRITDAGNEEGLLGLAFHPSFATNGWLFVNYTAPHPLRTVISRFTVRPENPDAVDPASEKILLEFDQPFENHNGGQLAFGPDGYLYIGTGDGGSAGDPFGNGQSLRTLLGKVLRIDVNSSTGRMPYGIPPDNPFLREGQRGEIWAYGIRNGWRFSFDPPTGRLWLGDVGQDAIEEIDIIEKGRNYGWNIMEGNSCFRPSSGCDTTGLSPPVWQYTHALGVCVIGGYIYHGARRPELEGTYIYADYGSGRIWSLRYDGPGRVTNTELLVSHLPIASFGVDANAEMYLCAFDGKIYRFK